MTDIFVLFFLFFFFIFGITRPYIAFSGYIWVDVLGPHKISYGILAGKPLSLIMALFCFMSFVINVKKLRKPVGAMIPLLLILFSLWITYTTNNAYFQGPAWFKWDFAIKTIIMSFFLYFVINTKEQLEFCLITFISSISYYVIQSGIKSFLGGGGYGRVLISTANNSGLTESSTLAMVSVILISLLIFLNKHTLLLTKFKDNKIFWRASILVSLMSVIGTQARTGLVSLLVFIGIYVIKSQNKIRNSFLVILVSIITLSFFASDTWMQRMDTMNDIETDTSAMGRVAVWKWTWAFVKENPNGGGFHSYLANAGELYAGSSAKAFHSIYFETLGEHGYIGLLLFLMLIFFTWMSNSSISKYKIDPWISDLAMTFNHCLLIFCVGGAFIGVAFQPIIYYFIAFSVSLKKIKYFSEKSVY